MRVSYNILREYLRDLNLSPTELADLLGRIGIEVEEFIDLSEGLEGKITSAVVKDIRPIDDSGLYKLLVLSTGDDSIQVVSTAPNLRKDLKVVLALPGAKVGDTVIQEREIKGFKSGANILSYEELGLPIESQGVIELPDDFEVGVSPLEYLGLKDWVYDLYIFPHRPDLLGIVGIAIELSVHLGTEILWPKVGVEEVLDEVPEIEIKDPDGCPIYTGRIVKGVKVKESPFDLQIKLAKLGQRPINNIVDITNYVMFELGQPIHAFDLSKVDGGIVVRRAKEDEKLLCLDGELRSLNPEVLVIADRVKPLAIAGVIGGEESSVTLETRDILIESAYFDRVRIRKASNLLGVTTESSRRFERSADPGIVEMASRRVAYLVQRLAGGMVGKLGEARLKSFEQKRIKVYMKDLERILGKKLEENEVKKAIDRLGFAVHKHEGHFEVIVPTRRRDIELWEDLAEELLKIWGYDSIEGELRNCGRFVGKKLRTKDRLVKEIIAKYGFYEVKTVEFASPFELKLLGEDEKHFVRIKNPLNADFSCLRTTLIPGILRVASLNLRRGVDYVKIFEVGKVFLWRGEEELPKEEFRLCALVAGEIPKRWDADERPLDLYDLLVVVKALNYHLKEPITLERVDNSFLPYLRNTARLFYKGEVIGYIGELSQKVKKNFDIKADTFLLEIKVDPLEFKSPKFKEIPQFPATSRDISVLIPENETLLPVLQLAQNTFGNLLEEHTIIDIYRGKPIPEGMKSVTLRFVFRSPERTLTQREVDEIFGVFASKLQDLGYEIRGLNG